MAVQNLLGAVPGDPSADALDSSPDAPPVLGLDVGMALPDSPTPESASVDDDPFGYGAAMDSAASGGSTQPPQSAQRILGAQQGPTPQGPPIGPPQTGAVTFGHPQDIGRMNSGLLDDLNKVASGLGFTIRVGTAITGHSQMTTSGNVSRHTRGWAGDIDTINGVTYGSNPKLFTQYAKELQDALVQSGYTKNSESGNQAAVLFGFNDPARGGNHLNHVHVSNKGSALLTSSPVLGGSAPIPGPAPSGGDDPYGYGAAIDAAAGVSTTSSASGSGKATGSADDPYGYGAAMDIAANSKAPPVLGAVTFKVKGTDVTATKNPDGTFNAVSPTLGNYRGTQDQILTAVPVATFLKKQGESGFNIQPSGSGTVKVTTSKGTFEGTPQAVAGAYSSFSKVQRQLSLQVYQAVSALEQEGKQLGVNYGAAQALSFLPKVNLQASGDDDSAPIMTMAQIKSMPLLTYDQVQKAGAYLNSDGLRATRMFVQKNSPATAPARVAQLGQMITDKLGAISSAISPAGIILNALSFVPGATGKVAKSLGENVTHANQGALSLVDPLGIPQMGQAILTDPKNTAIDMGYTAGQFLYPGATDPASGRPLTINDRIDGLVASGGIALAVEGVAKLIRGTILNPAEKIEAIQKLVLKGVDPADIVAKLPRDVGDKLVGKALADPQFQYTSARLGQSLRNTPQDLGTTPKTESVAPQGAVAATADQLGDLVGAKKPQVGSTVGTLESLAAKGPPLEEPPAGTPTETQTGATSQGGSSAVGAPDDGAVRFTTAKGSTYEVNPDGTTTRNKAPRPEHPGDEGPQPPSEKTYYVSPDDAIKLAEIQTQGGAVGRRIAELPDGSIGIQYVDGKDAGKFERRTVVTPETEPRVGLTPVELWKGGERVHFGNAITDVTRSDALSRPSELGQGSGNGDAGTIPSATDNAPTPEKLASSKPVPAAESQGRRVSVNGNDYHLTGEALKQWNAAEAEYKSALARAKRPEYADREAAWSKAAAMEFSAEKRRIVGEITSKEQTLADSQANKLNYGAKVTDGTRDGVVTSQQPSFGKVKVKWDGGFEESVDHSSLKRTDAASTSAVEGATPIKSSTPKSDRIISVDAYNAAKRRLAEGNANGEVNASSGFDPDQLRDYLTIGAYHLENLVRAGANTFKAWAEAMQRDVPDLDHDQLRDLYTRSVAEVPGMAEDRSAQKSVATSTPAEVAPAVEPAAKPKPSYPKPGPYIPGTEPTPRGETTGVSQAMHDRRGLEVERGKARTPAQLVEDGRKLEPEADQRISEFEKSGRISPDDMTAFRARMEKLSKATRDAFRKYGQYSTQYKMAKQSELDWANRMKPAQSAWGETGRAQQGQTDIESGQWSRLTGADKGDLAAKLAFDSARNARGETADPTPKELEIAARHADEITKLNERIAKLEKDVQTALKQNDARSKSTGGKASLPTDAVSLRDHFRKRIDSGSLFDAMQSKKAGAVNVNPRPAFSPREVRAIWEYAKANYIDANLSDSAAAGRRPMGLDEIAENVGNDLGLDPMWVKDAIASPKSAARVLSDAQLKAEYSRRQAISSAKAWTDTAGLGKAGNFLKTLWHFPRTLETLGHGGVMMETHAGPNLFDYRTTGAWVKGFLDSWKSLNPVEYERLMQRMENKPDYAFKIKNGLKIGPGAVDDFSGYNKTAGGKPLLGKFSEAGNRGADMLKVFRDERFDKEWAAATPAARADPEFAKMLANQINHESGTVSTDFGALEKPFQELTFGPSLMRSRWARAVGDPYQFAKTLARIVVDPKSVSAGERYLALYRFKRASRVVGGYVVAGLGTNWAIQKYVFHHPDDENVNFEDPSRSDWLKFKISGRDYDPSGGMVSLFRTLYNFGDALVSKPTHGDDRWQKVAKVAERYGRGTLTPSASILADLADHQDAIGRPVGIQIGGKTILGATPDEKAAYTRKTGKPAYSLPEYAWRHGPIPLSDVVENYYQGLQEGGVSKDTAMDMALGLFSGLSGVRETKSRVPTKK